MRRGGSSPAWTGRQPAALPEPSAPQHGWPPSPTRSGHVGVAGCPQSGRENATTSRPVRLLRTATPPPLSTTPSRTRRLHRAPGGAGSPARVSGCWGDLRAPAGDAASAFLRKGRPASRPCAAPCPWTPLRTGRSCASTARRPSPSVRRRRPSGGNELTGADPAVGLGPSHMGPRSGDCPQPARTWRGAPRAGREGGQRPDARVGSHPSSETPHPSSS